MEFADSEQKSSSFQVDDEGLVRAGSRLKNAVFLSYDEKYPVILDGKSSVARMIVRDYHRMYFYGGPQLLP